MNLTANEWANWALLGDPHIRTVPIPLKDLHARLLDAAVVVEERITQLEAERDKLATFKAWVHSWLDANGVPVDPYPENTALTGCRISGRMEWFKHASR